jgi:hypothetical protein
MIKSGRMTFFFNAIGLPFLARHLVTFDFPNHTMYLKRRSASVVQQRTGVTSAPPTRN